jgi:hypothetical protein
MVSSHLCKKLLGTVSQIFGSSAKFVGAFRLRRTFPQILPRTQGFYGLMMAHFAMRGLMHEAALKADEDPDRLSFLNTVRVVRRKLPTFSAITPSPQEGVP